MKTASIGVLVLATCACMTTAQAQAPQPTDAAQHSLRAQNRLPSRAQASTAPKAHARGLPSPGFLASDDGRAWMQVSGHPISKALNERFGEPSPAALARARARWQRLSDEGQPSESDQVPTSVSCNNNGGARFNLEPRNNAVFQNAPSADFILNGVTSGDDLIVQAGNDWRGAFASKTWDGSMSGYYVHTSSKADCSVQFEGGLPNFSNYDGVGQPVVAADSTRGAFFMADDRFPGGFALFRASAADLLNPKVCPPGTHHQAQADSCWMRTPPVLVEPTSEDFYGELGIVVDERPNGAGKGAGDVYVVSSLTGVASLMACTNALNCSSLLTLAQSDQDVYVLPFVQVRQDGVITLSYVDYNFQSSSSTIEFVTCVPAGAPNVPTCQPPVTVATAPFQGGSMANINLLLGTAIYPQFANRRESDGKFTTFMVYQDCVNVYNAPVPQEAPLCLNTAVNMTFSQDGGQTWSTPVSLTPKPAQHFYPAITNDASTRTVSIAYYSTEGDSFFRNTRVFVSTIPLGSTQPSPARPVTGFTPIDDDPGAIAYLGALDYRMGAIARGTGTTGQSHLYLSFDSETVDGIYGGKPLPELNNHIELVTY